MHVLTFEVFQGRRVPYYSSPILPALNYHKCLNHAPQLYSEFAKLLFSISDFFWSLLAIMNPLIYFFLLSKDVDTKQVSHPLSFLL